MRQAIALLLAVAATASAQLLDLSTLGTPRAALDRLEKNFLASMRHDPHRMSLVDAALHTFNQTFNPCRPGWMMDNVGQCNVCDFTLSGVPGCNACTEPGICSGCGEGYKFVAPEKSLNKLTTGTCVCETAHLNDPNCAQCGIAGGCDQCYNGYFPDPATKVCKSCDYKKNCRVCESATVCNICAEGHFLHADGSCRHCKSGCMECEDGHAGPGTPNPRHAPHRHCMRCIQGLYPDPTSKASGTTGPGSCMAPAVGNCSQPYEKDAKKCAVCAAGFSMGANSTACNPCKAGCLKCADGDAGTETCLRCTQDTYPDLTNPGACVATAAANCMQASNGDAAKCVVCAPGYALLASGQCASCSGPGGTANCVDCAVTGILPVTTRCTACRAGCAGPGADGKCTGC